MNNEDQQTKVTYLRYKMVAGTGYLLDLYSAVDQFRLDSPVFTRSLKRDAQKFRAGLERAEAFFTRTVDRDRTEVIDQLSQSYHLVDRLLEIHPQAEGKRTQETRLLLADGIEAVVKKYGLTIGYQLSSVRL